MLNTWSRARLSLQWYIIIIQGGAGMKRYFYTGNALTKKLLDNQYSMVRQEDQIYRDALLAALKLQPKQLQHFNTLRETMLDMTIDEQKQYATNCHMEQVFGHLSSLYRNSRGRSMMVRGRESLTKDLVDPDKFPIWDLKKKPNVFYSIWNTIMGKIRHDLGYELVVRNSLIEHPDGGRGVFVNLAARKKQIEIGELLGLVPGTIYHNYESYKKIRLEGMNSYEKEPQHLHFPSGRILELGQYKDYDTISQNRIDIEPVMVNPYSLGQFINHPPYGQKPNAIFTEIEIPRSFYPSHLRKYLPYNAHLPKEAKKKDEMLIIYGIFARQPIKNHEQLYVDYCQNHIYPIDGVPEWMVQPEYEGQTPNPDAYSLNLSKEEYEHPFPLYWRLVEKEALRLREKEYQQYLKVIKHRPRKVVYQDQEVKISSMKMEGQSCTHKSG